MARVASRRSVLAVLVGGALGAGATATAVPTGAAARIAAGVISGSAGSPVTTNARQWGVTIADVPGDVRPLAQLAARTGRGPDVVMWYVAWSGRSGFPAADADRVRAFGATPEITWEPWDPSRGTDQPDYSLARIADGSRDGYLTSWARAIAAWRQPLRLRFAHEMNGSWYPWARGVNGNAAGSYVAAWLHVRRVFAAAGATNVTWVWSPNVPFPGTTALADVFPGDGAVDEVALDGYNWAGRQPGTSWTSFADVFGPGMQELSTLSSRPISIGEVGCPQDDATGSGGSKARWLADMWRTLESWPRVRGLVWFDFDKEADWRIDSSAAAAAAFARGLPGWLGR